MSKSANSKVSKPQTKLPVLALRDTIVFPGTMFPVLVGRAASVSAVNKAIEQHNSIILVGQRNPEVEEPAAADLYRVGTLAHINQVMRLPNSLVKVLVGSDEPVRISRFHNKDGVMSATFKPAAPKLNLPVEPDDKLRGLIRKTRSTFERFVLLNKELPEEVLTGFDEDNGHYENVFMMASYLDLDLSEKQDFLEQITLEGLYTLLLTKVTREMKLLEVSSEINEKVQEEIQETQRKFFIQEQIKTLQSELDEGDFADPELAKLKERIDAAGMPEEPQAKCLEELERLKKTPQMSPEYGIGRNYIDWMLSIPWKESSEDNLSLKAVEEVLDHDHFGLEKAKDRILEHIAVLNLVEHLKGQILCFVGPPGVGKTSMAKSIARALNRQTVRISLGGVSDEAEIRGHRRTYIGSMPGRIIQGMRKAGTINPVMILDEIDKVGNDYRGDPSSAILEVLDPEQNNSFNDHYLDVDYDLSGVMFIATANVASSIQPALLDRMEIISLPGYLEYDKMEIARKHLIPKTLKAHGLDAKEVSFEDSGLLELIRNYTSEAGVRALEQQIAAVSRKIARLKIKERSLQEGDEASKPSPETKKKQKTKAYKVDQKMVSELLGVAKYRDRALDKMDKVGSVNGLAWTSTGGAILQIDVAVMKGKTNFRLTGKLGDVMKESAQAALTYIRANADAFDIPHDYFEAHELHIHIPEGAIPKDGPSAGMAMVLAILSRITGKKVRHDVAMTGEITLRGEVLPIGGLNEKLLAAQRNKIKLVLIPADNAPELVEIPEKVRQGLDIRPVSTVQEAMELTYRSEATSA
jgi:ATP-dependent Lon protease